MKKYFASLHLKKKVYTYLHLKTKFSYRGAGTIGGTVAGIVVFIGLIILCVWCCRRRRAQPVIMQPAMAGPGVTVVNSSRKSLIFPFSPSQGRGPPHSECLLWRGANLLKSRLTLCATVRQVDVWTLYLLLCLPSIDMIILLSE